jgi:hypothetical protein
MTFGIALNLMEIKTKVIDKAQKTQQKIEMSMNVSKDSLPENKKLKSQKMKKGVSIKAKGEEQQD